MSETEIPTTALIPAELQRVPTDEEIQEIRRRGNALVAYRKEVSKIFQVLEGLEWGSGTSVIKGSQFSEQTRYALAVFCRITGANPLTHIDILGGKPYLNAEFWSDKINADRLFHHYEQRDISASKEDRANWSAPEWAKVVIETTIFKFIPDTPFEKIQSGEITDVSPYLVEVVECNWAGGRPKKKGKKNGKEYEYQPDPVGEEEPAKTARTRSLRRAARRAFSAWAKKYDDQIHKAEEAVEAEFEIIQEQKESDESALPAADEPQAVQTGEGEPAAATDEGAVDLPDVSEGAEPEGSTAPEVEPEAPTEPSWNVEDDRKRYFATLRDAGIEDRKAWQKENGLPESTKEWGPGEYQKAFQILTKVPRQTFEDGCEVLGLDPDEVAHEILGCLPDTIADYKKLNAHLNALADKTAEPELDLK